MSLSAPGGGGPSVRCSGTPITIRTDDPPSPSGTKNGKNAIISNSGCDIGPSPEDIFRVVPTDSGKGG